MIKRNSLITLLAASLTPHMAFSEPSASELRRATESPLVKQINASPKGIMALYDRFQASSRVGGKRFANIPPSYLPQGDVHLEKGKLVFTLLEAFKGLTVTLTIRQNEQLTYQRSHSEEIVAIPGNIFRREALYHWTLKSGTELQQGSFRLIDAESNQQVEHFIEQIQKSDESEQSKWWLISAVYDEQGLYSARDLAFNKLKNY